MFNLLSIRRKKAGEKGQAIILVLILLTLASLIVPALLGFIATGAKSGTVYDKKTAELYAADAGIQDAIWQIKYANIENFKKPVYTPNPASTLIYSPYDFQTVWSYPLLQQVNNQTVNVSISNEWMPYNITAPTIANMSFYQQIIDEGKLTVTDSCGSSSLLSDGITHVTQYTIKIIYSLTGSENMQVSSVGVWLPPGCTYFSDSTHTTNFEGKYNSVNTYPYKGSYATVWTFPSPTTFKSLGTGTAKIEWDATFYFKPPQNQPDLKPQAVSWIVPVAGTITMEDGTTQLPISWDADNRIFKLTSVAGSTTVDSYIVKSEIRQLVAAIGGDYYATGNSNLSTSSDIHFRDTLNDLSPATVDSTDIPANATVKKAFLYWSGWKNEESISYFTDNGPSIWPPVNWNANASWSQGKSGSNYYFKGTNDALDPDLELKTFQDLHTYAGAIVSWKQWETPGSTTGSQQNTAASDTSDMTGTWTSTGGNRAGPVTDALDTTYITQTAVGVGSTYFGYTPAFSIPTNATISDVTVNYRAEAASTITFVGKGAVATATKGNVTPALPTGWAANDIFICIISSYDNKSASMPSGWSQWCTGTGGSSLQFSVFYKRAVGSDTAPTVTHSNNSGSYIDAVIVAYRGCVTTGDPSDVIGNVYSPGSSSTTLTYSSTSAGITTTIDGDMVLEIGSPNSNFTSGSPYTPITPTPNKEVDLPTAAHYNQLIINDFTMANHGSTGTRTSTLSGSARSCGVLIALEPAPLTGNVHSGLKVNGALNDSMDSGFNPTTSYTNQPYVYTTNPATGVAWTVADVNNNSTVLQSFGVYATQGVRISQANITVNYSFPLTAADGLYFEVYNTTNGWSDPIKAFQGSDPDITTSKPPANNFSYSIPEEYLTANFKIKLLVVGFGGTGNYANVDDIQIAKLPLTENVVFEINNTPYSLTADDVPQTVGNLISNKTQFMLNSINGTASGFSYSCYRDVTNLVQAYATTQGYATYKVGSIDATAAPKSNPDTEYQIAYAGWSIVIVYQSDDTLGHQLYLYDNFKNSGMNNDVDFNGNGGVITGFIVPQQITGAVNKITIDSAGSGYSSAPTLTITGGGGTGASAMAVVPLSGTGAHTVTKIIITNAGSGYTSAPIITLTGGGGSGAAASVHAGDFGDELNVGKITTFVGEGDGSNTGYTGDYLALNDRTLYKLWDGINESGVNTKQTPTDVFNSQSYGITPAMNNGIDIDTLGVDPPNGQYITWASGMLNQGDISATIYLHTNTDVWNLVYIIISFRSLTTTGGSLSYLIH